MTQHVDQLKEEVQNKEHALGKGFKIFQIFLFFILNCIFCLFLEHCLNQMIEKEKEKFKTELQQMKKNATSTKANIDSQQSVERKLIKIIQDADAERTRQMKQLEQVRTKKNPQSFVI